MSLDHTKLMLETLRQFHKSAISLTLINNDQTIQLSVSYKNKCYEFSELNSQEIIETHDNMESALLAIELLTQNTLLETTN